MSDPKPDVRTASAYLILERASWRYDPPRIVAMRKEKPTLTAKQIAVKVNLRIPMALFDQFIPVIQGEISEPDIIAPAIELEPEVQS